MKKKRSNDESDNSSDDDVTSDYEDSEPAEKKGKKKSEKERADSTPPPLNIEEETNPYLILRANRIARNHQILVELGLVDTPAESKNSTIPSEEVEERRADSVSTGISTPGSSSTSLSGPTRKSPRIAARTVDLTGGEGSGNNNSTSTSAPTRTANLSINSPDGCSASASETSAAGRTQGSSAKKRLWNSDMAKANHQKYKSKLTAQIEKYGEQKVLHPFRLKSVEVKKGRVMEDSKEKFVCAMNAFISHHANFNCRNINTKNYITSCKCLSPLLSERNGDLITKQVSDAVWEFVSRTKECQKLVMKEWLRNYYNRHNMKQRGCKNYVDLVIPATYVDAPRNLKPFKVCLNALALMFDYGYDKISNLRKDMNNAGLKKHGLINKPSNLILNNKEKYEEIKKDLNFF